MPKLDKKRIKQAIEKRLAQDPIRFGKLLRYSFEGCRHMRVGHYRIIFKLERTSILIGFCCTNIDSITLDFTISVFGQACELAQARAL